MGCGASKAISADPQVGNEPMSCSITHIRDMAPTEVADTGAHPPVQVEVVKHHAYFQRGKELNLELPGVVPESSRGNECLPSNLKTSASLIKMHPPKKPQRLEEEQTGDVAGTKINSPEIQALE